MVEGIVDLLAWLIFGTSVCCAALLIYSGFQKRKENNERLLRRGEEELRRGEYENAITRLSALGNFSNSAALLSEAREKLRIAKRTLASGLNDRVTEKEVKFYNALDFLFGINQAETTAEDEFKHHYLYISSRPENAKDAFAKCSELVTSIVNDIESKAADRRGDLVKVDEYSGRIEAMKTNLSHAEKRLGRLRGFDCRKCRVMLPASESYGKPNQDFLESVDSMGEADCLAYLSRVEKAAKGRDYEYLAQLDLESFVRACWKMAMAKPFSSANYHRAEHILCDQTGKTCSERIAGNRPDAVLATYYSQFSIAGEDVVCEKLRKDLERKNPGMFALFASFFMWIGANRAETMTLESMLSSGYELTPKMQDRLYSLKKIGGKAGRIREVNASGSVLYFDISALEWSADDLGSLFDRLAFNEKPLTYSLALRESEGSFALRKGDEQICSSDLFASLKESLVNEYGEEVAAEDRECMAISDGASDGLEAVLVQPKNVDHLGILTFMVPVGRRATVKLYTLFMPRSQAEKDQRKEALSLYSRSNPVSRAWEEGLTQSILSGIERALNVGQSDNAVAASGENEPAKVMF